MKQPIKKGNKVHKVSKSVNNSTKKKKRTHPQYGTSKLEEDFAHDFLDKLGIEYVYQFEAKDIGRFYDFYIPPSNLLIELDGDYWHGNREIYEEKNLKGFQRRAQRVDEYKDKWALMHGIPIMRIWEHDIRKNPSEVMKRLKERLYIEDKKIEKGRKHRKIL